jgi:hypothetical protein
MLEQVERPWEGHILKMISDDDSGRECKFNDKDFEKKLREIIDEGGLPRYIELDAAGVNDGHLWGIRLVFRDFMNAQLAMESIWKMTTKQPKEE